MMSYLIPLLSTLAICFGLQSAALRGVGGRTSKSESNFFSSLGRIQAGAMGSPEMMLLGSSITGRLPDRAQGFPGVANLGCDGGSAVDVLRAMDEELLPVAPVLVIEVNYLHRALDPTPSEVGSVIGKPWFRTGLRFPQISAYARPSAFVYSALLERRIGPASGLGRDRGLNVASRPRRLDVPSVSGIGYSERRLIDELVPRLKRLQQRSCRLVFVWLPPGRPDGAALPAWIEVLIAESGSEWWDLSTAVDPKLVELTDGVHMAADSAARTVISLQIGLRTE